MPNIIYSKKYPKETEDDLDALIAESLIRLSDKELDGLLEPEQEANPQRMTYEEIMAEIHKDVTYEDLPGREEKSREFIQRAIEVSIDWEFDIEIRKYLESVIVDLSFDGSRPLGNDVKELIDMADDLEIFLDAGDRDVTLNLQYYTKAVYRRGRRMHP